MDCCSGLGLLWILVPVEFGQAWMWLGESGPGFGHAGNPAMPLEFCPGRGELLALMWEISRIGLRVSRQQMYKVRQAVAGRAGWSSWWPGCWLGRRCIE